MSEIAYGIVNAVEGLCDLAFAGPLPRIADQRLDAVLRDAYRFAVRDLTSLVAPSLTLAPATNPTLRLARIRVDDRARSLGRALNLPNPPALARRIDATLVLRAAPADVRRSHEALARATMAVARAESLRVANPTLAAAREALVAADRLIDRADLAELEQAAHRAGQAAVELERANAEALAREAVQARAAADALARAAALWEAVHADGAGAWVDRHAAHRRDPVADELRRLRAAYLEGDFVTVAEDGSRVARSLTDLLDDARRAVACEQRDALAREAAATLRAMGYACQERLVANRRVVEASRSGRRAIVVGFDEQARFDLDSAHGAFAGAACSVEVNRFLRTFAERTRARFELEERRYVGGGNGPQAGAALAGTGRRRLSAAKALDHAAKSASGSSTAPPASVAAAWSRLFR
ncbi:MAG: hypothetical protein KIS66_02590 [Fimbriimonadaceae bacterium]|nr:hypothetical protein [Fimbriimonadaceae bacterium]